MLPWLLLLVCPIAAQYPGNGMTSHYNGGRYMALVPTYYNRGGNFTVRFILLQPVNYGQVKAELYLQTGSDPKSSLNQTMATGTLVLRSDMAEGDIVLRIPDEHPKSPSNDDPHRYRQAYLRLVGSGSLQFTNDSIEVSNGGKVYKARTNSIFIQTDKGTYTGGQTVRYRVFVLDEMLKPVDHVMTILIMDSRGNKIKVHRNVSGIMGVSGELQLSDEPTLGTWSIVVEDENEQEEFAQFNVDEYVLPTYDVYIELPTYGTVDNPELKGKVVAKYTYGKPVKGEVTLYINKLNNQHWMYEPEGILTKFDINGEADFSISMDTLLKFSPVLKHDTLFIQANVTERETGETRFVSSSITFHEKPVSIEVLTPHISEIFHPGFPYTTYLKVSYPDGRPVRQAGDRLKVTVTFFTDKKVPVPSPIRPPFGPATNLVTFLSPFENGSVLFMPDKYLVVPRDGVVKVDLEIPDGVKTGTMDVTYKDQTVTQMFQRYDSVSDAYLRLQPKTNNIQVGEQAEFTVTSNVRPNSITYMVIKDRKILETQTIGARAAFSPTSFYVTMTPEMYPSSSLVVYFYHRQHGELIADGLTFFVDKPFLNNVSLRFDRAQVPPASNVSLIATADPDSQIFIRVVDKRVLLKDSSNDITKEKVQGRMGMFRPSAWRYRDVEIPRKINMPNIREIFWTTGLRLITDACPPGGEICHEKYYATYRTIGAGGVMYSDSVVERPSVKVRKEFPETWLWLNNTIGTNGVLDIETLVPDSITDWAATAFALNPRTGIGMVDQPANLTAFLPFYVSLHLPYSVVSEEIVVIQALVFNYYPYDMYVTVKLHNSSDDFVGLDVTSGGQEQEVKEAMEKCLLVKSDDVTSAYFTIKPSNTGSVKIKVEATSSRGKDIVERDLIVRPPGEQKEENIASYVTLGTQDIPEEYLDFDIPVIYPPRIVPGSQRLQVTVIGDIFGPSVDHLDRLLQIPYGSGEQNMVKFAPAVYAANYFNATDRYKGPDEKRIGRILETGYQKQLRYRHRDGSYSTFGDKTYTAPIDPNTDNNGSLWLTAFVMKTFAQAHGFTYIADEVMESGVMFILNQQQPDGSFNSTGDVYNQAMQGSTASSSRALAAYVLTSLLEIQNKNILVNETVRAMLSRGIQRAWSYLSSSTNYLTTDYEMALAAYAFAMMRPGSETDLLRRLNASRNILSEGGSTHWQDPVKSQEIETTAYVLLTYLQRDDKAYAQFILHWLLDQRTPYGGFHSTQDTVVGLQALAAAATSMYNKDVNMTVAIVDDMNERRTLVVNSDNRDILQLVELPPETRYIRPEINGSGTVLVEVGMFYNILNGETSPHFDLRVSTNSSDIERFSVTPCARWLGHDDSGMVAIEVAFPSGYEPLPITDLPTFQSGSYQTPDRIQMDRGNLVLFYKQFKGYQCYNIEAVRKTTVGKPQPASVTIFSYYDTEKTLTKFYLPNVLKKGYICDFCGKECGCGYDPDAIHMSRCYGLSGISSRPIFRQPGRIIQPLETFQTIRQRLQPNQWRRGQTIPVSFNSGRTVSFGPGRSSSTIHRVEDGTIWRTIS